MGMAGMSQLIGTALLMVIYIAAAIMWSILRSRTRK